MTFGLPAESRELLAQIARGGASAPGAAAASTESSAESHSEIPRGPAYLPLGEDAPEDPQSALPRHWLEQQAGPRGIPECRGLQAENTENCLLHSGTMHHKRQMGLLGAARRMLKPGGRLILVGEYLRGVEEILPSNLPTEFSLLQLARRLGFRLLESVDWTAQARRSVLEARALVADSMPPRFPPAAWLRSLLTGMRANKAAPPAGAGGRLLAELDALNAQFETGHRRFAGFLFELDAAAPPAWIAYEFGGIDSFEPEEVARIFEESFGGKFDPALWRWKYGSRASAGKGGSGSPDQDADAGRGASIVARDGPGGPVIAHYGGVAREIDYFGDDQIAFQGCDVMVKPSLRRQYGRNSLYFHMTATLFEREIGYTVKHVLGFGFPNQPVMNTARRLGLYGKVDDFLALAFDAPGAGAPALSARPLQLQDPAHVQAADALWLAMRRDFGEGVIGKRHGEYLSYRYFQHPHAEHYFPLLLEQRGGAAAIAVLKRHEQNWLLLDAVAPLRRMNDVIDALRAWTASRQEPGGLKMWLTRAWVERLSWAERIEKNLGIEIPFNAWNPGPDRALPQGAWWLTAGDMDFM